MNDLTPIDHKTRLISLAALWQAARKNGAVLIHDAEVKATALENEAAEELHKAIRAAEDACLSVRHDIETGIVRVFHLVEVDADHP